jgi:hypothetical protein
VALPCRWPNAIISEERRSFLVLALKFASFAAAGFMVGGGCRGCTFRAWWTWNIGILRSRRCFKDDGKGGFERAFCVKDKWAGRCEINGHVGKWRKRGARVRGRGGKAVTRNTLKRVTFSIISVEFCGLNGVPKHLLKVGGVACCREPTTFPRGEHGPTTRLEGKMKPVTEKKGERDIPNEKNP